MLRGTRTGKRTMRARQHIYRLDGSRLIERTGARLEFKHIPGQGPYWKWADAARFELWSLDSTGHRERLVRTGPKVVYCLRDLKRTDPGPRSPRSRVFPKCSQDPRKRTVTLGTSVGWSDVYPSQYYEQWIDVTGLRGCFAYVHRADPKNRCGRTTRGTTTRSASCGCRGRARAAAVRRKASRPPSAVLPTARPRPIASPGPMRLCLAAAGARPRRRRRALDQGCADALPRRARRRVPDGRRRGRDLALGAAALSRAAARSSCSSRSARGS